MKKMFLLFATLLILGLAASSYLFFFINKTEKQRGVLRVFEKTSWCGLTDLSQKEFVALISEKTCKSYPDLLGKPVEISGKRVACSQVRPAGETLEPTNISCFETYSITELRGAP